MKPIEVSESPEYRAGWEAGRIWQRRVAYLDVQSFCERRLDEWDSYGTRPQVDRILYEDISQKLLGRKLVGRNMWHEATDKALFKGPISEIRMSGDRKIFVHTNHPGAALVIEPGGWIEIER